MPALTSIACRQSMPAFTSPGTSGSTKPHEWTITRQLARVRPVEEQLVPGLHDLLVHPRRHERPLLETHVLVKEHAVRESFLGEEDFQMHDGEARIGQDHVLDPVGIEGHAYEHVFVAAERVHLLEWRDAGPGEEALLVRGLLALVPVALERDTAAVELDQVGLGMLQPCRPVP